jgi:hypothetical protein
MIDALYFLLTYFLLGVEMRLPKWLKRRKGKNPFEGSLIIDNPDIKVVEAKYDNKPVLLAVGTSKQRELKISGKGDAEGIGGKYQSQKDLEWQVLFNPKALPDFIPLEKAKELMAGTVAVSSADASVYSSNTKFIEIKDKGEGSDRWLDVLEKEIKKKGKKLEEANIIVYIDADSLTSEKEKKQESEEEKKASPD